MKKKLLISLFLVAIVFTLPSTTVFAEGEDIPRLSEKYPDNRYDLMTYADDKWYQWAQKTGTAAIAGIKNLLWNINVIIANITLMVIYQLFSLDVVALTKDSIMEIASGTAGSLVGNLGTFALAIASIGIVIRAYIKQNWQAFFQILTLVLVSLALLFSIQTKSFNYVDAAHTVSVSLENAIMNVNPSLTSSQNFQINPDSGNVGDQVSVQVENKAFESLLYKPYLLLQYGTTDEGAINAENSYEGELPRIEEYLSANPVTEDGQQLREDIAKYELEELNNESIFAGNGFLTSAYTMGIILSTIVQGIVFFFLALMRIMLQFGFIFMLILLPFMLFMSLFPTFEALIGKYTKGLFMVILFKAVAVFFVLVGASFITLSYEMADLSDDIYYRIFIQVIFALAIIFMYMKRSFVMDMLNGGDPNLGNTGTGEGMGRKGISAVKNGSFKSKKGLQKAGSGLKKTGSGLKKSGKLATRGSGKTAGLTAVAGKKTSDATKNARSKIDNQMNKAKDYVGKVQNGEIPNQKDSPYHEEIAAAKEPNYEVASNQQQGAPEKLTKNVQGNNVAVTPSDARNPRNAKSLKATNRNGNTNPIKKSGASNVSAVKTKTRSSSNVNVAKTNGTPNVNARSPKPANQTSQYASNSKQQPSFKGNNKPTTQSESQQQIKKGNEFTTNKQTSRNPYQHINEKNQQNIRKQANASKNTTNTTAERDHVKREGMLNQRSLLHGKKED